MLYEISIDLHIHSCLSPCSSLDMSPIKIVKEALAKNLSLIAITDHNSTENVQAVIKAAEGTNLHVLPGVEITTSEEIHTIGLFPSINDANKMQDLIYDRLQPGENDEDLFGMQVVANELDEVESMNNRLLIGATSLSINEVIDSVHKNNGLIIAAHIDRESYSVISQLGFIPDDFEFDCLEVSKRLTLKDAGNMFGEYKKYPFITSSDSHELEDIGSVITNIIVGTPDFLELKSALEHRDGRKIIMQ